MRTQNWFALAVRVFGLVVLIPGLGILLDGLLLKLGYFNLPDTHPTYYLIYGAAQIIIGFYLFRGAPFLVDLAYPGNDDGEVGAEETEPNNTR